MYYLNPPIFTFMQRRQDVGRPFLVVRHAFDVKFEIERKIY